MILKKNKINKLFFFEVFYFALIKFVLKETLEASSSLVVVIGNFNINIRSMYDLILVLDGGVIPASTVVGIILNVIGMCFPT